MDRPMVRIYGLVDRRWFMGWWIGGGLRDGMKYRGKG
jgi:hypothetical protein